MTVRFIVRSVYLVFIQVYGTELLKPLEFPVLRVIKVSFVMLMSDFLRSVPVARETNKEN